METIPLSECQPGHIYRLRSRKLTVGAFNQADDGFVGIREKFGSRSLFTEYHRDIGPPHGTAAPYEDLGPLPDGIEAKEYEAFDSETKRQVEYLPKPGDPKGAWYYVDTGEVFDGDSLMRDCRPLFEYLDQMEKSEK